MGETQGGAKIEIARIQAEVQLNQMRIFADMMNDVLAASRGSGDSFGSHSGVALAII